MDKNRLKWHEYPKEKPIIKNKAWVTLWVCWHWDKGNNTDWHYIDQCDYWYKEKYFSYVDGNDMEQNFETENVCGSKRVIVAWRTIDYPDWIPLKNRENR